MSTPYPYHRVSLPSDLDNESNGKLAAPQLVRVFFAGLAGGKGAWGQAHHAAYRSWFWLCTMFAAANPGCYLTVTSVADAYRTYWIQLSEFDRRYTTAYNPLKTYITNSRVFLGKRYYLRRGFAPMSSPGMSNHGWGLAFDVQWFNPLTNRLEPIYGLNVAWQFLSDNALDYGFSWETDETWHIRYWAGDDTPIKIINLEAFFNQG